MIRALAIMWTFREEDILTWTLDHLLDQEIDILVIDNHSDDLTLDIARGFAEDCKDFRVRVDRWPLVAPTTVSWAAMLRHTAQLALIEKGRGYDWILHHDADEFRYSQRAGETLLEAIARLDAEGYTAIDHAVEVYKMRETWDAFSYSPAHAFTEKYASHIDMTNGQVRCWRQPADALVDLAGTAGHNVQFEGRAVAPEKLLMRHYPLRTPDQAARKIAARERWDEKERATGWHLPHGERVKA